MEFNGSPTEFECIYEDDYTKFSDKAFGGATYSGPDSLTDSQRQRSGWFSRYAYMAAWFAPRLMQVKGRDTLTLIEYVKPYEKKVSMYWATGTELKNGRFYIPQGTPFREFRILNPTDEVGFPNVQHCVQVLIDGSIYEARHSPNSNPDKFEFSAGREGKARLWRKTITIPYDQNWKMQPWQVVEVKDGTTSESEFNFGVGRYSVGRSPLDSASLSYREANRMDSIQVTSPTEWRRIDFDWLDADADPEATPGEPPRHWLHTVSYSGSPEWSESGKTVTFSDQSGLSFTTFRVAGGKLIESSSNLAASRSSATISVESSAMPTTVTDTSVDGKVDVVTIGDTPPSVLKYSGSFLEQVQRPGGYTSEFNIGTGGGFTTWSEKSGWGSQLTGGYIRTVTTDRLGGPVSNKLTSSEGIVLSSQTGSDFTPWGAPKKITGLHGEITTQQYHDTGANLGEVKEQVDAFGLTRGVELDWFDRVSVVHTGFDTLTNDYSVPGHISGSWTSGATVATDLTDFGETKSKTSSKDGGTSVTLVPGGESSITVEGRTRTFQLDPSNFLQSIGNGAGSRGQKSEIGVENGLMYHLGRHLSPSGQEGSFTTKTFYDLQGRIVMAERNADTDLAGANRQVETWEYNDAARTITYQPPVGPTAEAVTSTLSADGKVRTISVGGRVHLRQTRQVSGSQLIWKTELNDDSESGVDQMVEMSRLAIDPSSGVSVSSSWGLPAADQSLAESKPDASQTVTIASSVSGSSLTLTKTGGVPSAISGEFCGVPFSLDVASQFGSVIKVSGTAGGFEVGAKYDSSGRLIESASPNSKKVLTYGNVDGGWQIVVNDTVQQTSARFEANSLGDTTLIAFPDDLSATILPLDDSEHGYRFTINGSVSVATTFEGRLLKKEYTGLTEIFERNSNGSLSGWKSGAEPNWVEGATISETPLTRTWNYSDGQQVTETFYRSGPRSTVISPSDKRSFTYQHQSLKQELHSGGVLSGWKLIWEHDALRGLPSSLSISHHGSEARRFEFDYDAKTRLRTVTTPGSLAKVTGWNPWGPPSGMTRGLISTTWAYQPDHGRLVKVRHSDTSGNYFEFRYPDYDSRGRILKREASSGVSWTNLAYDSISQLQSGQAGTRSFAYGYDTRGNRTSQGTEVSHVANGRDQIVNRTLTSRGFGVSGSVSPLMMRVAVSNSLSPGIEWLSLDPDTGGFSRFWNVPPELDAGKAVPVDVTLRGVGSRQNPADPVPLLRQVIGLVVPPVQESVHHDAAGRLVEDAFWTYQWDAAGRLTSMGRKIPLRHALGERLEFLYDADGRRISKRHITVQSTSQTEVEESQILWAGWLPVLEIRLHNQNLTGRRWFQWGPDLSGSLEGAGGIGGLMAIIEENNSGEVTRTLLPIQDGLGNITAILNAATADVVARYDYGPFGEPLQESGESDTCPFRWQSKWFDAESQQYYFGFRYFDPRLGRWLSRDPLGENGGLNLYAYCGNDPVNRHDPLGLADQLRDSNNIFDVARINPITGQPEVSYGDWTGFLSWLADSRTYSWKTPNAWDLQRLFVCNPGGGYSVNADPNSRMRIFDRQKAQAFKTIPDQVMNGLKAEGLMTVAGVAGVFTGGGAYGFLAANGARTGFAFAGSSMAAGAVSDLTLQGGEMLTGDRSAIDLNQTLNSTGFSLALGMGGYGFSKGVGMIFSGGSEFPTLGAGSGMFRRTTNIGEFADLPVTMNLRTVRQMASAGGVGLDGIKIQIVRDASLKGSGFFGWTRNDGKLIQLYPDAFSSLENLIKTLGHERIHVYQYKTFGPFSDTIEGGLMERGAVQSESAWWQYFQLNN